MKNKEKEQFFIIRMGNRIYNSRFFNPIRKITDYLKDKIEKSIRFELMLVFAICFVISMMFYGFTNDFLRRERQVSEIVYDYDSVTNTANIYMSRIEEGSDRGVTLDDTEFFNILINDINSGGGSRKAFITDLDGNVIFKSSNVVEDKVDLFTVLSSDLNSNDYNRGNEKRIVYPFKIGNDRCYFIYSEIPEARINYQTYEVDNSFLALILSTIVFIIIFIVITNKKMKYLDEIALGLKYIASGNLDYRIKEVGSDEIRNLATNINNMAEQINNKIESERIAEKTKADLITNVSHDLRTPLTSIMGYIGLVKDGRYENEDKMKEYLNVAFTKSEKLKELIEDLFEYTKLNNDGIKINKDEVNISEFIFQLIEELMPMFEESGLSVIKNAPDDKIFVDLDPSKMLRVFENLLTNAIKYSYKPGNIVVGVYKSNGYATIAIRNKGANISQEKLNKLFERFYRVDESRNAQTGGSGLGLAISKNIVDLHGGSIWAECHEEDITFYVKLKTSR